jgi:2-polyprenyl-3-methyl-5-hydroxy-6-metoxy-1,4-benzoquinol methylase
MSQLVLCNYCQLDDATEVFAPGVAQASRIVRCNRCSLMYANPRAKEPDHVQIQTWDPDMVSPDWHSQRLEKEKLQVRDYAKTRALLNQAFPKRGKLLEIGSGFGYLLTEFRNDGWEVLGVEPDRFACRYAKEKLGVDCMSDLVENAGIPNENYDVVIMNHVIEHLDDPLATLKEINRLLKPRGYLVLETPRYDTLMFRILGRRERSINCVGHIYFFTTQTLKNLYEAAGFQTLQLNYVGRSLTIDRLFWNVGIISKNKYLSQRLAQVSRKAGLNKLHIYLNFRDMQRVCVQKVLTNQTLDSPAIASAASA